MHACILCVSCDKQECLGAGDGAGAARAVLNFSDKQTCVGKEEQEAFCREMDGVFRERCRGYNTVRLSHMLSSCALLWLPVSNSFLFFTFNKEICTRYCTFCSLR